MTSATAFVLAMSAFAVGVVVIGAVATGLAERAERRARGATD